MHGESTQSQLEGDPFEKAFAGGHSLLRVVALHWMRVVGEDTIGIGGEPGTGSFTNAIRAFVRAAKTTTGWVVTTKSVQGTTRFISPRN